MVNSSLNVVMIGPFAFKPKGTVSARAFFMARALAKRGHRVTILMPPYDNPEDSGRAWEEDGVLLENMVLGEDSAYSRVVVPLRMARRTMKLVPDVIHVFKPVAYSGLAGMYLRLFSGYPLVLDTDDWEGTGGWNDVNDYPRLGKRLFDWQERWLPRHADAVTVASRTLQAQVWGFGVDPSRVIYLPNGPDARLRGQSGVSGAEKAAIRQSLGVGGAPLALYLGHIPAGTDLDLAIDALAALGDRLPEARLVIAGVGHGLAGLQRHAQAAGVAGRVVFPGWVEHDQAHRYVAAADVIVNPYRDTLINRAKCAGKVVSAMALGKPVITSRIGENLEYIEDGRSGLLVEPGDVGALAEALAAVLSEPGLAESLGRNARQRIWARFDWERRTAEVERAYGMARQGRGQ
ncbi:MAG: glycosyltransferase family 4 protein [Anaerolineae bacterium]|jgi:glycosyltransferase involved in cell wall biosynthesis